MTKAEVLHIKEVIRYCKDVGITNFSYGDLKFNFQDGDTEESQEAGFFDPKDVMFAASEGIRSKKGGNSDG